jgi:hypothetical protein
VVVSDGWVPSKTLKGVAVLARVWGGAAAEPTAGALQGLHGAVKGGGKAALKDKSSKKKKKKGKKDKKKKNKVKKQEGAGSKMKKALKTRGMKSKTK